MGTIASNILGGVWGICWGGLSAYIKVQKAVLSMWRLYLMEVCESRGQDYTLLESSFSNQSYSFGLGTNYHLYLLPHNRLELDIDAGFLAPCLIRNARYSLTLRLIKSLKPHIALVK